MAETKESSNNDWSGRTEPDGTLLRVLAAESFRVLTVDDDIDFQNSLGFALKSLRIGGKSIEHLKAYSYAEASTMLAASRDIVIAFVDVVMETDDAGLRLVKAIREVLGNAEMRLVLLTGQPGMAPMPDIMATYDINDYWMKAELNSDRLRTILIASVRSFSQISEIARAKRGLQLIVESSDVVFSSSNHNEFSSKVLQEIAKLLGVPPIGLVCAQSDIFSEKYRVMSATGAYSKYVGLDVGDLGEESVREALLRCFREKKSSYGPSYTCLFFEDTPAGTHNHAAYVSTGRELDGTEKELLRVFCVNISGGLQNVSLISRLDRIAYEDEFLSLPNRNMLLRLLDQVINRSVSANFNLILMDINGFSAINTTLGSKYGDSILRFIATHLRDAFDPNVTISRIRDDLFALLGPKEILSASRVQDALSRAYHDEKYITTLNVSTATLPLENARVSALETLACAYRELKTSKRRGINQNVVYDPRNDEEAISRFQRLRELQDAMTREQIAIDLQPQISLEDGRVVGFEALARWLKSDGSRVSPAEFIPLAEATGLIVPLGMRVLGLACQAAKVLAEMGYEYARIGVNVSAVQFEQADIVGLLESEVRRMGLMPQQFEIEATESVAMGNFETIHDQFQGLRDAGFQIAIDDFGTGFSSLSYLSRLPADRLKIDKSFVDRLGTDERANTIAQTVIDLSRSFGMRAIAEGVENEAQATWLASKGCHEVQGYLYARPMAMETLIPWLEARGKDK